MSVRRQPRRRPLFLALVVVSFLWLWVNKPPQEKTVLAWGHSLGLTLTDLLSVVAVIVAGWLLLRRR